MKAACGEQAVHPAIAIRVCAGERAIPHATTSSRSICPSVSRRRLPTNLLRRRSTRRRARGAVELAIERLLATIGQGLRLVCR
jgi:hypothetical protein